jgi:diguanylate cyclase (GGDEF)-like protein/PAS domain S-box-containing protein
MKIYPIIILILSILVQLSAAILALRLIRITRWITAWTFIAAASLLMALRRCLTLYGWFFQDSTVFSSEVASDITSLGISILMLIGVAMITPLFKAIDQDKKQLAQSKQEFQLLVNNIPAIVFTGYQDGTVRFYDNKVQEITGYAREIFDSHRTKWADIVVQEDWLKTKDTIVQALKTDRAYVREYRIKHKNGQLVWLQERSRIICDAEGQIDHISGVFFDITEKKQVEAALHDTMAQLRNTVDEVEQSRLEFQLLVNNIPASVFKGYRDGTVKFYDNKIMDLTGYTAEIFETKRTKWTDIVHEEDWPNAKRIFLQALKTDRSYVREYRIRHKNGQLSWLQERSRIVCDANGHIDHISGVFFDITEKRLVETTLHDTMAKLRNTVNEVEQRNLYISLLNELGELLQACLTPQEAYKSITQVAPKLFPDLAGSLYIVNPRKSILLEAVASWGGMDINGEVFMVDECWALRRGGVHIGKPTSDGLLCKHISSQLTKDYLCLPLIAQGEILGLFYLQDTDQNFSNPIEFNQHAAVTVAKQISMSLANLNLRESLHIQAIIDPLTGLFNRRYMEETLDREIHRGKRREASIGIIMVDIDHFKRVNDNFGHEAGDMVLTAVAGLLKKHIRHEDIPCRYGGEEFLLILPEANLKTTFQRAEELRLIISQLEVRHHGLALGKLTASFGVSICPEHGENVADIINAADSALYLAKTKGRNQVVIAENNHETGITHGGVIDPKIWQKH